MKKIIFSTILLLSIVLSSCTLFAAKTNTGNVMSNVGDAMQNVAEGTRNAVGNAENGIETGAKNAKNAITGVTNDMQNGAQNMTNGVINSMDGDYNAERTAGDVTVLGMSTNTWTWLIIAIVGIAIVGLVWYYGAQYEHKNYDND